MLSYKKGHVTSQNFLGITKLRSILKALEPHRANFFDIPSDIDEFARRFVRIGRTENSEGDFQMFKNIFITLSLIFSTFAVNAQEITATQILNQIHAEYSKRFDSNGNYIDDQNRTDQFKNSQLQAIQILRQNKMIGQSFQIQNSAMADLVVTVSIVQEKNLDFAGLLIERSKYEARNSDALLRLFNFPILAGGMSMLSFNGSTVVHLKSLNLTPTAGGIVVLKFPTDFNSNQFSQSQIAIIKTPQGFSFKSPAGESFRTMFLKVWYSIFSQNFGIENVSFQ